MKTLFIGDIVGKRARDLAYAKIKEFKSKKSLIVSLLTLKNSAGGFGVTPEICNDFFEAGIDVLLGIIYGIKKK